jgi:hypothetical protein
MRQSSTVANTMKGASYFFAAVSGIILITGATLVNAGEYVQLLLDPTWHEYVFDLQFGNTYLTLLFA